MKTYLIAGGAGFIGTNLSLALLSQGNKVICFDNLVTGQSRNLDVLKSNENFEFRLVDISKELPLVKCDVIFNLACPASPPKYQIDPMFTISTCIDGIRNLIKIAEYNDAVLVQSSTSEIYGDPDEHHYYQDEEYFGNVNTYGPRSCYDESKRMVETILYANRSKIKVRIARIFNTFGPYMDPTDGRVVSNFINQALRNQDITIYGDGSQTRSLMYVEDLIMGLIYLSESEEDTPINFGNPGGFTSVKMLAEKVIEYTGSKSKIIYQEFPENDPKQRCPDVKKAEKLLTWYPTKNPDWGLKKTIEYYKSLM